MPGIRIFRCPGHPKIDFPAPAADIFDFSAPAAGIFSFSRRLRRAFSRFFGAMTNYIMGGNPQPGAGYLHV